MKISAISYQNFGKKLLSCVKVRNADGKTSDVNFVEYEPEKEEDRAQIRSTNMLWQPENGYLGGIASDFTGIALFYGGRHFYGLEDETGGILAVAETEDIKKYPNNGFHSKNCVKINYIQTCPDDIFLSSTRYYKGLGETLVSNMVKKAKKDRKHCVSLKSVNEGFWAKSGYFKPDGTESGLPVRSLSGRDFSKYIEYVEHKISE